MQTINNEKELHEAIVFLEAKLKTDGAELRVEIQEAFNSIKPMNLIKNAIKEVIGSDDVKEGVVQKTVGYGLGFGVKKLFETFSKGPLTGILGTGIMFGVSNLVSKNPETVKIIGSKLLDLFKRKKEVE